MVEKPDVSTGNEGGGVFVQTAKADFPSMDRWQQVGEEEARLVYEMALRNELSGGTPVARAFEAAWREFTGLKYAISTCNGSGALFSAFFGLGVGPGDEVICPTYTWIGTIAPALFLGARPVFAECAQGQAVIDPEDIRKRITSRTRAIVVVHLWGWPCDMDAVMDISRETGVPVIEDCSHSHGAVYKGRVVGSIGRVGAWSLQGSKPVSGGEGGVIATDDPEVFDRACLVGQVNRIVGVDLATARYQELQPLGTGMKFRSHPLAVGIAGIQLKKLPKLNAGRTAYVETIEAGLREIPGLSPVPVVEGGVRGGFYGFPTLYSPEELGGLSRSDFVRALKDQGVPASEGGYELLHRLPIFANGFDLFTRNRGPLCGDYKGFKEGDLPVTEELHSRLVFLPMMTDPVPEAAPFVLDAVKRAGQGS